MQKYIVAVLGAIIQITVLCEDFETNRDNDLPQMYKMDNYSKCLETHGSFCLYDFKIAPKDNNSEIGIILRENQDDLFQLDRSLVHRMICVPKNEKSFVYYGKNIIEAQELNGRNLSVYDIQSVQCAKDLTIPIYYIFPLIFAAVYLTFMIYATWYHYIHLNDPYWPETRYDKFCNIFSVIKNYKQLTSINPNPDFQRLRSIQGIRVFAMILIVFLHTTNSLFLLYIDNIEELEKSYRNPVIFYMMFCGEFAVQIFFVISTFLLTNQVLELHRKHGHLTILQCFIILINRGVRFAPALIVMVTMTILNFYNIFPHLIKLENMMEDICLQHGIFTLFQVSFFVPYATICNPGLWYLSVDSLYYLTAIIVLYLALKCKLNIGKIAGFLIVGSCVIFGLYVYMNNFDFAWKLYPQGIKSMFTSSILDEIYITPVASWTSSCIGILMGYIYFTHKNTTIIKKPLKWNILWWIFFVCVPIATLYVSPQFYEEKLIRSIIAAILKPIVVAPLATGIVVMAFGLGGIIKTILESNVLLILSNVTFCTYVFHFFIVFGLKGIFFNELIHYESYYIVFWILFDLVLSFTVGAFCTIIIEYPGLTLQKLIFPQIKPPEKSPIPEKCNTVI